MAQSALYPDVEKSENLCADLIQSYRENRRAHRDIDLLKEKCVKFVHGEQWDKDVEAERAEFGLVSLVVDKTQGVYSTLDGWARRNRSDVQFIALGQDDPDKSQLFNRIYMAIKTQKGLDSVYSEAYGLAAITDEAFVHVYGEKNVLGQFEPAFEVLNYQECYPDMAAVDPIKLQDAEFIDFPRYMTLPRMRRVFRPFMTPEFKAALDDFRGVGNHEDGLARNQHIGMEDRDIRSGQVLVITRYYKKYEWKKLLVDIKTGENRPFDEGESELLTPEMLETMGFKLEEFGFETVWRAVMVPAVSENEFLMNRPNDFQPINPNRIGEKYWPVFRLPHKWIAGRACGAIRSILKLQESRNVILSSLQHHLQTAANGSLMAERGAITDPEEKAKFESRRNRAGQTIYVDDGALEKKRIGAVPKGEFAFSDAGSLFETILVDAVRDSTGAEPVMRGQSQQGAPASLFKQQVEQSQNQMLGSSEIYRDAQFHGADLVAAFVRQHYTENRVIQQEGEGALRINQATITGVLNDVTHGLMTVRKTTAPTTESGRRQKLSDTIEILQLMKDLGLPDFLLDYESLVQNMDTISSDRKTQYLTEIQQWKEMSGLGAAAEKQQLIAQAQQGMAPPAAPAVAPIR